MLNNYLNHFTDLTKLSSKRSLDIPYLSATLSLRESSSSESLGQDGFLWYWSLNACKAGDIYYVE